MNTKWRDDILIYSPWMPLNDDSCLCEMQDSVEFYYLIDLQKFGGIMHSITVDSGHSLYPVYWKTMCVSGHVEIFLLWIKSTNLG